MVLAEEYLAEEYTAALSSHIGQEKPRSLWEGDRDESVGAVLDCRGDSGVGSYVDS
jgi:hypothetical protein